MEAPIIEAISTWETPLFVTQLPDHQRWQEAITQHIYQNQRLQEQSIDSEVATAAKHQLFESKLDYLNADVEVVTDIKSVMEDLLAAVAYQVNAEFWPEDMEAKARIIESWYHITQNGGYHDVHSHPNCSWCGIYCVDAGDCDLDSRNGVNRFYEPRHNADHFADIGTRYLGEQGFWDFVPVPGQVIIFPSYLKHSALPYFGQRDRIVIAFNSVIREHT